MADGSATHAEFERLLLQSVYSKAFETTDCHQLPASAEQNGEIPLYYNLQRWIISGAVDLL